MTEKQNENLTEVLSDDNIKSDKTLARSIHWSQLPVNKYLESFKHEMIKGFMIIKTIKGTNYTVTYDKEYIIKKLEYLLTPLEDNPDFVLFLLNSLLIKYGAQAKYLEQVRQAEIEYQKQFNGIYVNEYNQVDLTSEQ